MAAGNFTATNTQWGYAVSVTGGTGPTTTVIVPKGKPVKLKGVLMGGQATTDIFTLSDGDGEQIVAVASGTKDATPASIPLYGIRTDGLQIVHGGVSSTGEMSIFTE